ncbi:MAG: hypothetical protein ACDS79_04720 [Enterobacteriaceae bacterium]
MASKPNSPTLGELVAGITPENRHESYWGAPVIPMSYSPATLLREYQQIGEALAGDRLVAIYLHEERHHAAAVYAEPEDVNGQLRHVVIAKVDLHVELPKRTGTVLSVLDATGDKDMVRAVIDALDAAGFPVLLDLPPPPAEVFDGSRLVINGHPAMVEHDPEIGIYRGEFLGLRGGADFYAASLKKLVAEGETSLRVFLEACARDGLDAYREIPARVLVLFDDDEETARRWMYSPCRALVWKLPAEVSHDELSDVAQQLSGRVRTRHERDELEREIEAILTRHADVFQALADR